MLDDHCPTVPARQDAIRPVEPYFGMIVRLATDAMGTRFELVLDGADEFFLRAAGEEAIEEIREQHDRLDAFNPASLIGRLNARAGREPMGVDQELFELLELCQKVWRETDGAFDPALGGLMRRWGFRDEPATTGGEGCSPVTGFEAVELDERAGTVRFHGPILLDLGGVAKGWALDRAGAMLRQAGVTCGLVHGGTSTVVAWMDRPGERAGGSRYRVIARMCRRLTAGSSMRLWRCRRLWGERWWRMVRCWGMCLIPGAGVRRPGRWWRLQFASRGPRRTRGQPRSSHKAGDSLPCPEA